MLYNLINQSKRLFRKGTGLRSWQSKTKGHYSPPVWFWKSLVNKRYIICLKTLWKITTIMERKLQVLNSDLELTWHLPCIHPSDILNARTKSGHTGSFWTVLNHEYLENIRLMIGQSNWLILAMLALIWAPRELLHVYAMVEDSHQKIWINPLKESSLGMLQALFDS